MTVFELVSMLSSWSSLWSIAHIFIISPDVHNKNSLQHLESVVLFIVSLENLEN